MARLAVLVSVFALVSVALPPVSAIGQESIRPAREMRVVHAVDRRTGRAVRDVVSNPLPAEILRVQVELARAGHDPGLRSGVLDEPTRRALRGFQIVERLTICGCLTYETVVALGIRTRVVDRTGIERGHRDRERVIVVIPEGRRHPRRSARRRPGVSADANPGVSVGHAPVRGRQARPSRPRPGRSRIVLPNPPRGRPSSLRAVPRGGNTGGESAGGREARPRP